MAGSIAQLFCLAGLALAAGVAKAAEPLSLYYFDRPPYAQKASRGDEVVGLTATPAAQAFRAAGLEFRWTLLPTVRQLVTLKDSLVPACAVGWFKNPERELQFKFTKPIYRDRPTVALARSNFHALAPTLIDTLRQPGLSVLVKDGFSYGPLIDGMLLLARPERVVTSVESVAMVSMIAAQRASFMFAAEEEANYLVEQAGVPLNALKLVRFADVPPGERRYILCSKATPDELIERLNKAINVEIP
ncbi:MAG: transporter substrate-binding domain-containing protein [Vitreoscilla sp.]|nr:transporter substrate-binding domain-containing protein [Vitreoscilla sp.]